MLRFVRHSTTFVSSLCLVLALTGCANKTKTIDTIITGKNIYVGGESQPIAGVIGIDDGKIVFVSESAPSNTTAIQTVDAGNAYVSPGFIDPHTHACNDFNHGKPNLNANYLTQGVTTVFCNVDGGGEVDVNDTLNTFAAQGIGTNVGLYIGHGAVRRQVMQRENRAPSDQELEEMKALVAQAMDAGALGLSTGLYYVPGNYANTSEVIELARIAAAKGGVYDSHIRDESSYSIGLSAAIDEVIEIGSQASIPAHIAHIKALGVDVWGDSKAIIDKINAARAKGINVTADQYPWRASGTSVTGSLVPRAIMAGGPKKFYEKLNDEAEWPIIREQMRDNLRRRGGADSLLISDPKRPDLRGKNLQQIADEWDMTPVDAAKRIILNGNARVASFNMSQDDIDAFMRQPWVMTSSDGSEGHPRKYASFPKKYNEYVVQRGVLNTVDFINKSSTTTADFFGLNGYGKIATGYTADIVIFDPQQFKPEADYLNPTALSKGVDWLWVNGQTVIEDGELKQVLAGTAIRKNTIEAK